MKDFENSLETRRRDFLKQFAALGLMTSIAPFSMSCNDKELEKFTFEGRGHDPYKVWEEMLMALETSPDHLERKYKRLIAAKDPKAMFDFVRDEIHLMPVHRADLYGMQTAIKYGTKAVLRYGIATPREKAELLNEMYTKAGIQSKVVFEIIAIPDEEVPSYFYRPIPRPFSPKIDDATRNRWVQELGAFQVKSKG